MKVNIRSYIAYRYIRIYIYIHTCTIYTKNTWRYNVIKKLAAKDKLNKTFLRVKNSVQFILWIKGPQNPSHPVRALPASRTSTHSWHISFFYRSRSHLVFFMGWLYAAHAPPIDWTHGGLPPWPSINTIPYFFIRLSFTPPYLQKLVLIV